VLTPKKTNPAQTKIGELEVTMLINEKIIRLEITV
jgi:hypothetical protein